jgi:hypothetical protein
MVSGLVGAFRDNMASIVPKGLAEYSRLSLNARLAVALSGFENYCRVHGLRSSAIDAFLDYMWEHPCIASPDEFEVSAADNFCQGGASR